MPTVSEMFLTKISTLNTCLLQWNSGSVLYGTTCCSIFEGTHAYFSPQKLIVKGKPGGISLTEAFELTKNQITFTLK